MRWGDHAPREIVRGAVESARANDLSLILVGQEARIRAELGAVDVSGADIEVLHASEVVEMCEVPGIALRKKRDSSIRVGLRLVADGKASSFVSAGNSGAVMAGVPDPQEDPRRGPPRDRGDHPHAPRSGGPRRRWRERRLQAGPPAPVRVHGRGILPDDPRDPRPRVGVVSIGEEDSKGTDLTRDTCELFRRTGLNFVGNVEGRDFFAGKADVFVCDGFVGNVAIKTMEGMATALGQFLKEEIRKSLMAKVGALLAERALRGVKDRLDYEEYGGAPLLGVRGGVFICHGSSSERAIKNGIRAAGSLARCAVDVEIARSIAARGHAAANPPAIP